MNQIQKVWRTMASRNLIQESDMNTPVSHSYSVTDNYILNLELDRRNSAYCNCLGLDTHSWELHNYYPESGTYNCHLVCNTVYSTCLVLCNCFLVSGNSRLAKHMMAYCMVCSMHQACNTECNNCCLGLDTHMKVSSMVLDRNNFLACNSTARCNYYLALGMNNLG